MIKRIMPAQHRDLPCRRSRAAAAAIGIALALLALALAPRGGSDGMLVVDVAGEHCKFNSVFVGDQLIRSGTTCQPIASDSSPAQ